MEFIKPAKNGCSQWDFLSQDDFEVVLAIFCCYDYNAKAYHYCSLYMIGHCIATAYHQQQQKRLVTKTPPAQLKKTEKDILKFAQRKRAMTGPC